MLRLSGRWIRGHSDSMPQVPIEASCVRGLTGSAGCGKVSGRGILAIASGKEGAVGQVRVHAERLLFALLLLMAVLLTNAVIDGLASQPSVTFSVVSATPPASTGD